MPTKTEYIQMIAAWQARTGLTGAPPVKHSKELSNWIQRQRTDARNGHELPEDVVRAFGVLAIAIERGPTQANAANAGSYRNPRGFDPVCTSAIDFIHAQGRLPSIEAEPMSERLMASWTTRVMAGLFSDRAVGLKSSASRQEIPQVLRETALTVSSPHTRVAEWLLWCARLRLAFVRPDPGNNWHEAVFAPAPGAAAKSQAVLHRMAQAANSGAFIEISAISRPETVAQLLTEHLNAANPVKRVRFDVRKTQWSPICQSIATLQGVAA